MVLIKKQKNSQTDAIGHLARYLFWCIYFKREFVRY